MEIPTRWRYPARSWTRGWRRRVAARRLLAGLLAVLAAVLAVAGATAPPTTGTPVVVVRTDVEPGRALASADLELRPVPPEAVPAGALHDPAAAVGRRPVGAARAGEVLTDVRLVGPESARAAVGAPDAAGVPLRLADPAVAALVAPGDEVDVVGGGGGGGPGGGEEVVVLATGARVLGVLAAAERSADAPVVVVALPGPEAARVAVATLGREVTLTLR